MDVWTELKRRRPVLAWAGLLILLLMVPTALGLAFDPRQLDGAPVWLKPLKFQLSVGLYLLTLAWFFGYVRPAFWRSAFGGLIAWIAVLTGLCEVVYISVQAGLGQASHFNTSSGFHIAMYALMGIGAVLLTAMSALLAIGVSREQAGGLHPAFRLSMVLGLVLTFILGGAVGGVLSAGGGHWIGGTRSDLNGVPVFGWSRDGGDLRVAHFFGIHALHVLPVFGWLLTRVWRGRGASTVVWIVAIAYGLVVAALTLQALNGQPFIPG